MRADKIWYKKTKKYLKLKYVNQASGMMTVMMNVLGWVRVADIKGASLIVDIRNEFPAYKTKDRTCWDDYYYQPMVTNISLVKHEQVQEVNINTRFNLVFYDVFFEKLARYLPPKIVFPLPRDYKDNPELFCEFVDAYQKYFRFKPNVYKYIVDEYNDIIKDKGKVLGVIVRGTDYSQGRPRNHPIQPSIDEIITKIKELSLTFKWDYIYLATEEKQFEERFITEYPNRILTNKRYYYNDDFTNKLLCEVSSDRKKDEYLRQLEYISSMYILSKCDMLIGGMCGGSTAAMIMRGHEKYEFLYLFDHGNY